MKVDNAAGILYQTQLPSANYTWLLDICVDGESLEKAKDFIAKTRGPETHHADVRVMVLGQTVELSLEEFCERMGIPLPDGYRYNGE